MRPERERLEKRAEALKSRNLGVALEGHRQRALACLGVSLMPPRARTPEHLMKSIAMLADARVILDSVEAGRRPDPAGEGLDHPAGLSADVALGPVEVVPSEKAGQARLVVHADREAGWSASPFIYGTFSEPLRSGFPIYGMLHAQRLINSSFEFGEEDPLQTVRAAGARIDRAAATAIVEGQWLALLDAPEGAVANPWFAAGPGPARFSLQGGAYNTDQCQRIEAPAGSAGAFAAQAVALPAWRCERYRLRCALRGAAGQSAVARLYSQGQLASEAALGPVGAQWGIFEAELSVPAIDSPQTAFLFAIGLDGPGAIDIDLVWLTPVDAVEGFDPDAIDALRRLGGWLRWPGGNLSSAYRWREAVGPADRRPVRRNPAWQGLAPFFVGTDEFLRLCQLAGIEPMITVNAGDGTPEEAAQWVEYCNGAPDTPMGRLRAENGRSEPYGVRYWNVGNELWGQWQVGQCEALENASRFLEFEKAMKAADPSIQLIACGWWPSGEKQKRWHEALLDGPGDKMTALDFHTYVEVPPLPDVAAEAKVFAIGAIPVQQERALMQFRQDCLNRGLDSVRAVVGEYNNRPNETIPPRQMAVANFLAYAGWLHAFLRQSEYVMGANATEFTVFNSGALRFGTAHPRVELYALYAREAGSRPLAARLETPVAAIPSRIGSYVPPMFNIPLIDAVALRDPEDGSIAVGLLNRGLEKTIRAEIALEGFSPAAQGTLYRYGWSDSPFAPLDTPAERPKLSQESIALSATVEIDLPPYSLALLKAAGAMR